MRLLTFVNVFVMKFLGTGFSMLLIYVISNHHGPDGVGFYSYLASLISFGVVLCCFGLPQYALRECAVAHADGAYHYINGLFKSFLCVFLLFGFMLSILLMYFEKQLVKVEILSSTPISLAVAIVFFSGVSLIVANILKGVSKSSIGTFIQDSALQIILFILVCSFILTDQDKISDIFYIYLTAAFIVFLISLFFYFKFFMGEGWKETVSFNKTIKNTAPFFVLTLVTFGNSSIDILMLGSLLNAHSLGEYVVSAKVASFIGLILIISNNVLAPRLTQLFIQQRIIDFKDLVQRSSFLLGIGGG